jgi:light-regulated signal transduction histidine kinase (bacteriophytochrome)
MTDNPTETKPLPWGDGPYSIKRYGTTLTTCDSEPVQTPGCIQAHGALLVVRLGDLTILQASENTGQHLCESPEQLLGQPVARVVGSANEACLREMLGREPLAGSALYAFTLPAREGKSPLDVCVHTVDGVAVLEFESTGRAEGQVDANFFGLVTSAVSHLQAAEGLREFCQRVTDEVRSITGLDRVMVYRFHADNHGEVFAENKREDLHPWLGLHYPESDIPKPAREIYKNLWIRPLPNAAGTLVVLTTSANPRDLHFCYASGANAYHVKPVQYREHLEILEHIFTYWLKNAVLPN